MNLKKYITLIFIILFSNIILADSYPIKVGSASGVVNLGLESLGRYFLLCAALFVFATTIKALVLDKDPKSAFVRLIISMIIIGIAQSF